MASTFGTIFPHPIQQRCIHSDMNTFSLSTRTVHRVGSFILLPLLLGDTRIPSHLLSISAGTGSLCPVFILPFSPRSSRSGFARVPQRHCVHQRLSPRRRSLPLRYLYTIPPPTDDAVLVFLSHSPTRAQVSVGSLFVAIFCLFSWGPKGL